METPQSSSVTILGVWGVWGVWLIFALSPNSRDWSKALCNSESAAAQSLSGNSACPMPSGAGPGIKGGFNGGSDFAACAVKSSPFFWGVFAFREAEPPSVVFSIAFNPPQTTPASWLSKVCIFSKLRVWGVWGV